MISEGRWDTEDWSNDAENAALHQINKLHLKIYSNRNKIFKIVISQYLLYFLANKCSFGEHKRLIKNILKKNYTSRKCLHGSVSEHWDLYISI